jgi:alanyl-tRNA synthetase
MFTNSGMVQFKDVFLGAGIRDYDRAVNSQKCIRVSGKHNDLEEVGRDTYHQTFFEMLGNWSFNGSYGKEEAIRWAWDLLTNEWGVDSARLHSTVFGGDEQLGIASDKEAFELWESVTDISPEHVHYFGIKDNFWQMGDTGPCGPCSEIHIDLTSDLSGGRLVNRNDPRVMEIWNLVFMQYERDDQGTLTLLPQQHVDTGMGFERIVAVQQGKASNYDTDVFRPVIEAIENGAGIKYHGSLDNYEDIAIRVIADHLRFLVFVLSDGGVPGNKDRGAVIRRILRRAVRFGYQYLNLKQPFLHLLSDTVVREMGEFYPELHANPDAVAATIHDEESEFYRTIKRGMSLFQRVADEASDPGGIIQGSDVFLLHTTHGFPPDLVRQMADERGLGVDLEDYERRIKEHEEISRGQADADESLAIIGDLPSSEDGSKWEAAFSSAEILGWVQDGRFHDDGVIQEGTECALVLSTTCFYSRAGGQVGDTGHITTSKGAFQVQDTMKIGETVLHEGVVENGEIIVGTNATLSVSENRENTKRNHSSTHILNRSLADVLGDHIRQRGSKVTPVGFTFDFPNEQPLSTSDRKRVEELVNSRIRQNVPVRTRVLPIEEAKQIEGVRAEFGEKYGSHVRVVDIADYSHEFCGGTHVERTGDIGLFKIVREESVSTGIRRVTCVTGSAALLEFQRQESLVEECCKSLRCAAVELPERVARLQASKANPATDEGAAPAKEETERLVANAQIVGKATIVLGEVTHLPTKQARARLDEIKRQIGSGIVALGSRIQGRASLRIAVTKDLVKQGIQADSLALVAGKILGSGGGSPALAEAGGKQVNGLPSALKQIECEAVTALESLSQVNDRSSNPIRSLEMITYDDFEKVDIRVGRIVEVEDFPKARKPAYRVQVDFGAEIGLRKSSVQAKNYDREELKGMQILGVVNFPPKNIAGFMSEVLILGVPGKNHQLSLLTPSREANIGGKAY